MKALFKLTLVTTLFTLSACSNLMKVKHAEADSPSSKKDAPPQYQDFDQHKDTLYDLLVAEIAVQRQEFNITLLNYIQQARMTRDLGVIKRAVNAAQFLKDHDAITEMALLWVEVEPESIQAHQLLTYQYSLVHEYDQAMYHIEQIINLGGEARVDGLAVSSSSLPLEDKETISKLYQELYEKFPDNHEIGYSYALVQRNLKEYDAALEILEPILKSAPDFEASSVLKTNLLYDKGLLVEAIEYASDKFDDFPANHNLGRLYATMLIENKQLDEAEDIFYSLINQYPQSYRLKLSHAIVMLENQKVEEATETFNLLIEAQQHSNEANYYLARIADSEGKIDKAIEHYQQVKSGVHYELSLERSSYLMLHNDRKEEMLERLATLREAPSADIHKLWLLEVKLLSSSGDSERLKQSLNTAIEEFPEDDQLLYARAMNREADDDLAGMEEDLRKLIELNPKNAIAMNALGYTLADRTDRTNEAFELIKSALTLKPTNPAIQDSMGWVLYRLGQKKEALVFLLKAFQQFQDGEVAAHLGEVLWSLNQFTEAKEVWSNVHRKYPNHKVLLETIQRLDPELLTKMEEQTTNKQDEKTKEGDTPAINQTQNTDAEAAPED